MFQIFHLYFFVKSVHRDTLDRTAKNDVADSVLTENHVINSVECVIVVVGMDTLGTIVTDVSCRNSNSCEDYSAVTLLIPNDISLIITINI